jgi:hypothetical protein
MTAPAVAALVVAALAALAFARLGVSAQYGADGLSLTVRALFVRLRLSPRPPRKRAPKRKKRAKAPGSSMGLREIAPVAAQALGRLRHKLLIRRLVVRYTAPGGGDPVSAAIAYGGLSVGCAAITAALERAFRVKEREITASVDFSAGKPDVYVSADVSLAVWEAVYVACALLPAARTRETV